ncbi:MAG: class I SAM-dependent DNA methyltransferase [Rhodospirillales bacterium]|nr:class I SAM-dependent DNA methyltransferase [Rhodospirillales bacterium]
MPLSWNEIRARAARFADEWKDAHYEKGETQTFYNEFFEIFGNRRRNVAVYEEKVKKLNDKQGFIDLFWPSYLLIEQKSAGRDLAKARAQATDYFVSLTEKEKPRYILLSDFQTFELLDLEENEEHHFTLAELADNVRHFGFIAGYQQQKYRDQDPANIEASELMSNLHKHLEESGYTGHDLERLLVRIMFCLFAEDTGIFPMESFLRLIEDRTEKDGSDLGSWLIHLFQVLNTPDNKRQNNLDEDLAAFPYVNGNLFADAINIPSFDTDMREALLKCAYFNWTKVSPALFGSLFQTVMLPAEQRQGGAHYTSEKNILKIIHPLFLDELREEFEHIKTLKVGKQQRFEQLHEKLASLTFFDPACGCGNFLILAMRELRELELDILNELYPAKNRQTVLDIGSLTKISVDQFYGVEIEEFPARIAESAMWLVDHQMNMRLSESFGQAYVRLPLTESAHIYHGNALTTDWADVLPPEKCSYILGNPPFVGSKYMTPLQRKELLAIFNDVKGAGILDYVSAWYGKAAQYIQNTNIKCALVSTNSITQGEQVSVLWGTLLQQYGIKIHFAHRTFKWTIDEKKAKGMRIAAVYVVIVGFAAQDTDKKYLYEYETLTSDPHKIKVANINPYLVDGSDLVVSARSKVLCDVPEIGIGNKPIDGGYYLFTPEEKEDFLSKEPEAKPYFKRWIGTNELLYNQERWCLWLGSVEPSKLRSMPLSKERIEQVRKYRLGQIPAKGKPDTEKNKKRNEQTQKLADTPTRFHVENMPEGNSLIIPEVSSENRKYIPMGFEGAASLCSNLVKMMPDATLYHFGILSSEMHMDWMRYTCGRLEGRYRYSKDIVYNNFPWPEASEKDREEVTAKAQAVLDARAQFSDSTLADLYDPNTMPPALLKAHQALDKAVDKAYRKAAFKDEKERIEFLFERYRKLTEPLIQPEKKKRGKK